MVVIEVEKVTYGGTRERGGRGDFIIVSGFSKTLMCIDLIIQ